MSRAAGTKFGLGVGLAAAATGWLWNSAETRGAIDWAWTFFMRVIQNGPVGLWAVLLCVLSGWLVVLRVSTVPIRCLTKEAAALVAHAAGGFASLSVMWILWREPMGLIVGFVVGLSTPYTWALVLILLELCPGVWARNWAAVLRGEGKQLNLFGRDGQ